MSDRGRPAPLDDAARIAEIRGRLGAASGGPWDVDCHVHVADGCRCLGCPDEPTGWFLTTGSTLCCDAAVAARGLEARNEFGREFTSCQDGPFLGFDDADFAAHAREDVPFLLGVIERLRGGGE